MKISKGSWNERVIFYADDDKDDQETFVDAIDELNEKVAVYTLSHGEELLAALKNPPPSPSLVFLDLNMPGMNGFEVLQRMKQTSDLSGIPVVILSTSDDIKTIEACKAMGANYYISKPADFRILKQSINHALNIDWDAFNPDLQSFSYRAN